LMPGFGFFSVHFRGQVGCHQVSAVNTRWGPAKGGEGLLSPLHVPFNIHILIPRGNIRPAGEEVMDSHLKKFTPLVRAMARRYQGPGLEKEDLEQEAWLALLEAEASYRPELNVLRPAFYKSRVRAALGNVLRRYRKDALFWSSAIEVEKVNLDSEIGFELFELLSYLSQRQRQVIRLYYLNQLNLRQIAEYLGISVSAVNIHKQRGLAALARQLSL